MMFFFTKPINIFWYFYEDVKVPLSMVGQLLQPLKFAVSQASIMFSLCACWG